MVRPLRLGELAFALSLALVAAALVWFVLAQGSTASASVDRLDLPVAQIGAVAPVSEAVPPASSVPTTPPAPPPAEPQSPNFIPLPEGGTPTLTVRGGESIALHDSPDGAVVAELDSETEFGSATVLSVAERRGNWAGVPTELLPNGELGWVRLDSDSLKIDSVGTSIVVDLSQMRADLLRNGEQEHSWVVSIGGPSTPTPTGHFSITDEIEGGLNAAYGCCALPLSATQPNLPPGWTGGNRMAIHGTTGVVGQADSTGCLRTEEADLRLLLERVPLGTPVTIHS